MLLDQPVNKVGQVPTKKSSTQFFIVMLEVEIVFFAFLALSLVLINNLLHENYMVRDQRAQNPKNKEFFFFFLVFVLGVKICFFPPFC
jgi:hypothetical protein